MMPLFRKSVILAHRYLGIAISLLFVVWFASGITMMYAGGMPRLTPDDRLEHLPPVDLASIHLTPAQAADKAGTEGGATLLTVMDRPAYRIGGTTVFARGFGVRELGRNAAVEADTVFQLASLSKPIAATVAAIQVSKGVVGWDDKVVQHSRHVADEIQWHAASEVEPPLSAVAVPCRPRPGHQEKRRACVALRSGTSLR